MGFILAIDGPAGSGKGTIAKLLSERLNLVNIDTGAMYRCVALACLRKNISETQIEEMRRKTQIQQNEKAQRERYEVRQKERDAQRARQGIER